MNSSELTEKIIQRVSKFRNLENACDAAREIIRAEGLGFVPFGVGNSKTKLPGFYRKVGETCPPDCPYLGNGCYSEGGRTALSQVRASNDVESTVASFIACAVLSSKLCKGWPARMFVSGDLCRNGKVDRELVRGLKEAAVVLRRHLGQEIVGYGYTHTHDPELLKEFAAVGIILLQSDEVGAGCAIVHPHKEMDTLPQAEGFRYVKCPSQTSDHKVKCATCPICKEARRKGSCVVFDPHGAGKKKMKLLHAAQ